MHVEPISRSLPSFAEAAPLGPSDEAFVAEFRELLAKYGNLDRFGLCLLHQHFDVAPDEILLESNDPVARTLTVTPQKLASIPDFKATMWSLGPLTARQGCAEDKCKSPADVQALQGCAEDKCK